MEKKAKEDKAAQQKKELARKATEKKHALQAKHAEEKRIAAEKKVVLPEPLPPVVVHANMGSSGIGPNGSAALIPQPPLPSPPVKV